MPAKLQAVATSVLDWVLGTGGAPTRPNSGDCECALSTTSVNLTTGAISEPSDTNYVRASTAFNAAASASASNVSELSFGPAASNYPSGIQAVAVFNTAGTSLLYGGDVTSPAPPVAVAAGETPKIAAGALIITES